MIGTFALSKLKYKVIGHLRINDKGIEIQVRPTEKLQWADVKSIDIRRVNHFLIESLNSLGGAIRYYGVTHNFDYSEFYFDKVRINDTWYYILIRSRNDFKTLGRLSDYLGTKVPLREESIDINFIDLLRSRRFDTEAEM
jgi:hypothetical protein